MARAVAFRHPEPMSAINVTPFIDVLLVLLIMLILTIPIASHKVPVDLPVGKEGTSLPETRHELGIARNGGLLWDGRSVNDAELSSLLGRAMTEERPVFHMRTDPEARYERFDEVLAVVKRAGVERLGFVGDKLVKW